MPDAVHDAATTVEARSAITSELDAANWAVLSFDKVEGQNLAYSAALQLLRELDAKGIAGLCIVTDQTAARAAV